MAVSGVGQEGGGRAFVRLKWARSLAHCMAVRVPCGASARVCRMGSSSVERKELHMIRCSTEASSVLDAISRTSSVGRERKLVLAMIVVMVVSRKEGWKNGGVR